MNDLKEWFVKVYDGIDFLLYNFLHGKYYWLSTALGLFGLVMIPVDLKVAQIIISVYFSLFAIDSMFFTEKRLEKEFMEGYRQGVDALQKEIDRNLMKMRKSS